MGFFKVSISGDISGDERSVAATADVTRARSDVASLAVT